MAESSGARVVQLSGIRNACQDCSLFQLCLPVSLGAADVEMLDNIVERRKPMARGAHLYRAGDEFVSIYAVRAGALKTYAISADGEEQVTGFHLPGEIVGLDAISRGTHPCYAVALETTSLCEIPFVTLEDLAGKVPGLQHQLLRIMSQEIFGDNEMLNAVARRSAEERLVIALLSFSSRFGARGLSPVRFRLPMSRGDLSNYLGLAPETMSRLFRRLQDQGLLRSEGKEVHLTDLSAMRVMAGQVPDTACERTHRG
ncbi:fumarate/nitrate reduction transcriptional regulator Fnr [Alkalilimnicola sp. S0819]|uniref:fumarate/nitrate reduction transcriptional regulator Fnr n=1 Tax=Alkalilimnicola sp. S0819 TaxID=2613922 RepID=UPI001261FCA0|nr:fumarate/nitrate reduction transcriptional regulator Fnr [Alkalilimnicola sp. S0819]KAB7622756.1 fumarate/nitrate reduction transcriptional regulator Fnr [Alkalilimnicola sp. S0819]MPQ17249.1 fumarate/nitrate reduction transcriptional regulator Fnr [Alkalilimnicola sp. S0819]